MYIGFVLYEDNIVETVKVSSDDEESARLYLAEYVYTQYNDSGKSSGFNGILYGTENLKDIVKGA